MQNIVLLYIILIISKNTQLNELPCFRVDLILLHTALFHQMAHNANNADPRGLGICIGVLISITVLIQICGAIVKSTQCGRIQPFQIQIAQARNRTAEFQFHEFHTQGSLLKLKFHPTHLQSASQWSALCQVLEKLWQPVQETELHTPP